MERSASVNADPVSGGSDICLALSVTSLVYFDKTFSFSALLLSHLQVVRHYGATGLDFGERHVQHMFFNEKNSGVSCSDEPEVS